MLAVGVGVVDVVGVHSVTCGGVWGRPRVVREGGMRRTSEVCVDDGRALTFVSRIREPRRRRLLLARRSRVLVLVHGPVTRVCVLGCGGMLLVW